MTDSVWSLSNVTLGGRNSPRIDDVSLTIASGVTAVMGSSGAGKSSLLGLLTRFEEPDVGHVQFNSPNASAGLPLFWSPQDHGLWPHLTVEQHIENVLPARSKVKRSPIEWLKLFALNELADALPDLLSQGERSRLAIARALASEASVLVLDEPLTHVDPWLAHQCWQVIVEHFQSCCAAVVFSTHDPDAVLKFAQHVVCLGNGTVRFSGEVESLYTNPPSKELAWLLGICNWIRPTQFLPSDEIAVSDEVCKCIRPSQLELCRDASGEFVVEAIQKASSFTEVLILNRHSRTQTELFLSQLSSDLSVGDTVRIAIHQPAVRK